MPLCPTCQTKLSCGCQLMTASNGARVCASCKPRYEADLLKKKQSTNPAPSSPSNVHVIYNPPPK